MGITPTPTTRDQRRRGARANAAYLIADALEALTDDHLVSHAAAKGWPDLWAGTYAGGDLSADEVLHRIDLAITRLRDASAVLTAPPAPDVELVGETDGTGQQWVMAVTTGDPDEVGVARDHVHCPLCQPEIYYLAWDDSVEGLVVSCSKCGVIYDGFELTATYGGEVQL